MLRLFYFHSVMNKSFFTLLLGLLVSQVGRANDDKVVVHACDFNAGIPSTYVTYDLDAQTHHYTMVQAGIDHGVAWVDLRERGNKDNRYAASTSKFKGDDVQPANDWLVTPRMRIMSTDAVISWRAQSVCENIKKGDTYEVRVSTTGNHPEDFVDAPIAVVDVESINQWTAREANLGAYVGEDVYIAFVNRSQMCEILAIDDICVKSGHGTYEVVDVMGTHVYGSEQHRISGKVRSVALDKITEFTAYCRVAGQEYSRKYSNVDISLGEDFLFEFEEEFTIPFGDTLQYKMWADIQGERSDTIDCCVVSMLFEPYRRTVIEEGTGMWCGYCPLGIIAFERMKKLYPNHFIPIAAHYDDVLEVEGYAREMNFSSFPSGWVNRKVETVPMLLVQTDKGMDYTMLSGGFETMFLEEQAQVTVADVDLTTSVVGQELEINATARFVQPFQQADFRFAFIVVEDHLEGQGFYQTNYFNGLTDYTLDGFAEKEYRIFPFVFEDVARHQAEAVNGFKGSLPADIVPGQVYTFNHRMAIPDVQQVANARVVVLLLDAKTGCVVNANQCALSTSGIENVVKTPGEDNLIFDLSGRKLSGTPSRGVYIKNGQKFFVK